MDGNTGKLLLKVHFTKPESVDTWIDRLQRIASNLRAEQPAPAPAPWKPKAGDLVQITADKSGWFKPDTFVTVVDICACSHPRVRQDGCIRCLHQTTYLPVREEERPAKVGEHIRVLKDSVHDRYKKDDILHVTENIQEGYWSGKAVTYEHPKCSMYIIEHKDYRVLVPCEVAQ